MVIDATLLGSRRGTASEPSGGGSTPGGGRTLQSFLLRPFMRPPRKAEPSLLDTQLVRKIAGLTSLKGEDVLLQTQSEDPVRYHRLRASLPAGL